MGRLPIATSVTLCALQASTHPSVAKTPFQHNGRNHNHERRPHPTVSAARTRVAFARKTEAHRNRRNHLQWRVSRRARTARKRCNNLVADHAGGHHRGVEEVCTPRTLQWQSQPASLLHPTSTHAAAVSATACSTPIVGPLPTPSPLHLESPTDTNQLRHPAFYSRTSHYCIGRSGCVRRSGCQTRKALVPIRLTHHHRLGSERCLSLLRRL